MNLPLAGARKGRPYIKSSVNVRGPLAVHIGGPLDLLDRLSPPLSVALEVSDILYLRTRTKVAANDRRHGCPRGPVNRTSEEARDEADRTCPDSDLCYRPGRATSDRGFVL